MRLFAIAYFNNVNMAIIVSFVFFALRLEGMSDYISEMPGQKACLGRRHDCCRSHDQILFMNFLAWKCALPIFSHLPDAFWSYYFCSS